MRLEELLLPIILIAGCTPRDSSHVQNSITAQKASQSYEVAITWKNPIPLDQAIDEAAQELASKMKGKDIAVSTFNGNDGLPQFMANEFATALQSRGVRIFTRQHIEQVIEEQSLQISDASNPTVRVGQLVGANYIIVGDVFNGENAYALSLFLIDAETGRIVGASRKTIARTLDIIAQDNRVAQANIGTATQHMRIGNQFYEKGATSLARQEYLKAYNTSARSFQLLFRLGRLHEGEQAKQYYRESIVYRDIDLASAVDCLNLAKIYYLDIGDIDNARKYLSIAIELDPMLAEAYGVMSLTYVLEEERIQEETNWIQNQQDRVPRKEHDMGPVNSKRPEGARMVQYLFTHENRNEYHELGDKITRTWGRWQAVHNASLDEIRKYAELQDSQEHRDSPGLLDNSNHLDSLRNDFQSKLNAEKTQLRPPYAR